MLDGEGCAGAGLGPGDVSGAFDVPLGVLPLHDARCRASPSDWVEPPRQPTEEVQPAGTVAPVLVSGSAIFPPDPGRGFPLGATSGDFILSGILHLLFGVIGFGAISAAAFAHASWSRSIGARGHAIASTVLAQFTWLATACAQIYAWSPHPLRSSAPPKHARRTRERIPSGRCPFEDR